MQNANQEESYSGNKNSKPMHTCPNPSQNGVKIALIPSTTSGSCSHTYQNRRNQKHRQVALLMHTELWISYRFKQSPLCSGDIYTKSCDLWLISFSLNLWYAINLRKQRLNLLFWHNFIFSQFCSSLQKWLISQVYICCHLLLRLRDAHY